MSYSISKAVLVITGSIPLLFGCGSDWDPAQDELEQQFFEPFQARLARTCKADKIKEVTEDAATSGKHDVHIDCNLSLPSTAKVTKRLILQGSAASGITVNCNGAEISHRRGQVNFDVYKDAILIKSARHGTHPNYTYDRPTDITIRDCNIFGAVRVLGMETVISQLQAIRTSSQLPDHTARARAAAPTRITLYKLKITADTRTPLYLGPGVTHTRLIKSELKGTAVAAAVYLDAESAYNTLRNNTIRTKRKPRSFWGNARELISVDGSSHNKIINNRLSNLTTGGIYLYRNCGEGGVIRHAWPAQNLIINNVFDYDYRQSGNEPAVFFGLRENTWPQKYYCGYDGESGNAPKLGSRKDNYDYARYNVMMQNQFRRLPRKMPIFVRQGGKSKPNYVGHNEIVGKIIQRKAGCYVRGGYPDDFILHGQTSRLVRNSKGEPACSSLGQRCNDGDLVVVSNKSCAVSRVRRGCRVTGNNKGCQVRARCPAGKRVIAARAACNLEWGTVSTSQLMQVPIDRVRVVRPSDNASGSRCLAHKTYLVSGTRKMKGLPAGGSMRFACREHDKNGGDCHVEAQLLCH